ASGGRRCVPPSAPLLDLLRGGSGRLLLFSLPLPPLHLLPLPVEPRLEHAAALGGVFPREELRLLHMRDGLRAVFLLRPSEDRGAERIAPDEVREVPLEIPTGEVRPESLVVQVQEGRGDVLDAMVLDR